MPTVEDLILEKKRYGLEQTVSDFEKEMLDKGMPVQKIIGYIEMSNVIIKVDKKVLIPRYETEELVELTKDIIVKNKYTRILDMCSGSGYIGIALKKWNPNLVVTCADIDENAISQAKINAELNNVDVNIVQSDLFSNIIDQFDLIVSNPPYIDILEKSGMSDSVLEFEPHHALFAKDNGMYFYKEIESKSSKYISHNGKLVFEINPMKESYFIKNKYINLLDINGKTRFSILNILHDIK